MWSFSKTNFFFTFNNGLCLFFKNKSAISVRRKAHCLPITPSSKECEEMSCILTLYILGIMFIGLFIDQHLCIILCILDDILIISPTHFSVHWHHCQGAQFNFKFFETQQMITSTCWPHTTRSHFFTQNIQLLIIIKSLHWCVCLLK